MDDHPLIREGLTLRISLQPDLQVCGEAETEQQALALVEQFNPDLVLIDISLKTGNGIDLVKQIKWRRPDTRMLIVSGFPEQLYAERALRAGAAGYLSKQETNDNILTAIRAVLAGQHYFGQGTTDRLIEQAFGTSARKESAIETLTDRELQIFRMIGEGLRTGEIANRLFLSTHTIDTHREHLKKKLDLKTAGELTRAAVQWVLENS